MKRFVLLTQHFQDDLSVLFEMSIELKFDIKGRLEATMEYSAFFFFKYFSAVKNTTDTQKHKKQKKVMEQESNINFILNL